MTLPDANTTNEIDFVDSRPTLVKKYNIPVEHISYEYIKTCKDGREIERIIKILRSGEEGIFPDLLNTAEQRLSEIRPTSKVLRKEEPALGLAELERDRCIDVKTDLQAWSEDVKNVDQDLKHAAKPTNEVVDVPIRSAKTVEPASSRSSVNQQIAVASRDNKSVVPRSYAEWDKFDPEEELLRMETDEERTREEREINMKRLAEERERREKKNIEEINAKQVSDDDVSEDSLMTPAEKAAHALTEKAKGNECFKEDDLVSALAHFTASLSLQPSAAAYTNRALTHLRLENYGACILDCDRALAVDPDNVKALFRRASANQRLGNNQQAYADLMALSRIEPSNRVARELMQKVGATLRANRMHITEVKSLDASLQAKAKAALQSSGSSPSNAAAQRALGTVRPPKVAAPPKYHINKWGLASSMCECSGTPEWAKTCIALPEVEPRKPIAVGAKYQSGRGAGDSASVRPQEEEEKGAVEASGRGEAAAKEGGGFQQTLVKEKKAVEVDTDERCKNVATAGQPDADNDGMFFLHKWCTLRDDRDLLQHAKLLNSIKPEDLPKVIGSALDEPMLSQLLGCLDQQAELYMPEMRLDYLVNIAKIDRFAIVKCFMDDKDKLAISNIFNLLRDQGVYVPSALKTSLEQL